MKRQDARRWIWTRIVIATDSSACSRSNSTDTPSSPPTREIEEFVISIQKEPDVPPRGRVAVHRRASGCRRQYCRRRSSSTTSTRPRMCRTTRTAVSKTRTLFIVLEDEARRQRKLCLRKIGRFRKAAQTGTQGARTVAAGQPPPQAGRVRVDS